MSKIRTFLAIELPKEIKDNLREVQNNLKSKGPQVKWVRSESIHLTLNFFGNIEENSIDDIFHAVNTVVPRFNPFHLEVRGVGVFPNISRPRVIWAGIEFERGTLDILHKELNTQLSRIGFEPDKREFTPHLTLGRVKTLKEKRQLIERIERVKDHNLGSFHVDNLFLFKSDLQPTGAVYTKLKTFDMAKSWT